MEWTTITAQRGENLNVSQLAVISCLSIVRFVFMLPLFDVCSSAVIRLRCRQQPHIIIVSYAASRYGFRRKYCLIKLFFYITWIHIITFLSRFMSFRHLMVRWTTLCHQINCFLNKVNAFIDPLANCFTHDEMRIEIRAAYNLVLNRWRIVSIWKYFSIVQQSLNSR